MLGNTSNIKYEFLKTKTSPRSQSPPTVKGTVESPQSYDSSIRQVSLSPPRRLSVGSLPSPRGINMPNIQGRRVSFVRPQDVGDPFVNTYTDDGLRGRKKERKHSPPKWAKGKKEWNPEKLMEFWNKASGHGSPSRHGHGNTSGGNTTVKPTDVIDSFWQSHYGDVCPYKLKLPEKKPTPREHIVPKPRYVATKHKTNTRTSLALPDISPWKEKVIMTLTMTMMRMQHRFVYSHALIHPLSHPFPLSNMHAYTLFLLTYHLPSPLSPLLTSSSFKITTMPRPVTADLAGRLAVRSARGDTQRLRRANERNKNNSEQSYRWPELFQNQAIGTGEWGDPLAGSAPYTLVISLPYISLHKLYHISSRIL